MNAKLEMFARAELLADLEKCTDGQRSVFKLMYGRAPNKRGIATRRAEEAKTMSLDAVVAEIPADRLDWAMEQVTNSVRKNKTKPMKTLFQQIDDLCVTANMVGICEGLRLPWFGTPSGIAIELAGKRHEMPAATDRLWRRKWRKFLTNHVDDVAKNLDAGPAAARDAQSDSAV